MLKSLKLLVGSELERIGREVNSKVFHCPQKSLNFPFNWSDYSFGIVSSFSLFIPSRIIDQIPLINIHPSLLPQWRGPAPIQYTLLHGQDRTGVSIINLHPKVIDAGHILLQESCQIHKPHTIGYTELEAQLAEIGGRLAATVLSDYDKYNAAKQEQGLDFVTHSRKISKTDGIISFKTDSFDQISRKVRALSHQIPIRTLDLIAGKQVILEDITLHNEAKTSAYDCYYDKSNSSVVFKVDSKFISVRKFKIEGKSQIFPAGSFYSNYLKSK